jgi:hypothetical protein
MGSRATGRRRSPTRLLPDFFLPIARSLLSVSSVLVKQPLSIENALLCRPGAARKVSHVDAGDLVATGGKLDAVRLEAVLRGGQGPLRVLPMRRAEHGTHTLRPAPLRSGRRARFFPSPTSSADRRWGRSPYCGRSRARATPRR